MIALSMVTDISLLSATLSSDAKQYTVWKHPFLQQQCLKNFFWEEHWTGRSLLRSFWPNRPFPILQSWQQLREKMNRVFWDAASVVWEIGVGHSGHKISWKHVLSASRNLTTHLLRVCPLLLRWHLFGGRCKIPLVIHASATELGNSCSFSSLVMFGISPLNGKDCGLLRVPAEKKV